MNAREFWTAIKTENFPEVFGSLFSINALLPDEYRIEISDTKYKEEINKQGISIVCKNCKKNCDHCKTGKGECKAESRREEIKVKTIEMSDLLKTLTSQKEEKVWECPRCKSNNILSQSKRINNILPDPCYLKVIPNPPNRKDGILHRRTYKKDIEKWALQFFNELQHQMSLFRLNYKPKDQEIEAENEFMTDEDTKLEEFL